MKDLTLLLLIKFPVMPCEQTTRQGNPVLVQLHSRAGIPKP